MIAQRDRVAEGLERVRLRRDRGAFFELDRPFLREEVRRCDGRCCTSSFQVEHTDDRLRDEADDARAAWRADE